VHNLTLIGTLAHAKLVEENQNFTFFNSFSPQTATKFTPPSKVFVRQVIHEFSFLFHSSILQETNHDHHLFMKARLLHPPSTPTPIPLPASIASAQHG